MLVVDLHTLTEASMLGREPQARGLTEEMTLPAT